MLAAVFEGDGRLAIREIEEPQIASPGDVLIEVEACGICGSDVRMLDVPPGHPGAPGTVIGHEFVGRIRAVGSSVQNVHIGQRVVVDPDPKCGSCDSCRAGRPSDCSRIVAIGHFRNGALARLTTAPATSVYPIAEDVPAEIAAMTEPLACVLNGIRRADPRAGESAIVFGAGSIGCLFIAVLKLSGVHPIVVIEPNGQRHAIARAVGADALTTPSDAERVFAQFTPAGGSVVIDAVGSLLDRAIQVAASGGRIVLFGMDDNACPPIGQAEITRKGLTIFGSFITNFTFPPAVKLVESGQLPLRPILTDILPLVQTAEGIARIRAGEATKIVIRP